MKPITTQVLVGSFSALGSFLFGYDLSCIAMVVASDSFMNLFLQENPSVKSGTVVSLYTAGAFFGALFSGLTEKLGRRGAICLASSIFVVGGSIQTAGVNIGMLYAGRFIAGYGVGILVMTIPVFLSEIA
jgi:MFS family permease